MTAAERDVFYSLGDWGKQFGLLAVGFERYGSEEELQKNPIMHLFEVYVKVNKDAKAEEEAASHNAAKKPSGDDTDADAEVDLDAVPAPGPAGSQPTNEAAHAVFRVMEDGNEKTLAIWKRFRELSIVAYEKVYARLSVHFYAYSGESHVEESKTLEALGMMKEKDLLTTKTKDENRLD